MNTCWGGDLRASWAPSSSASNHRAQGQEEKVVKETQSNSLTAYISWGLQKTLTTTAKCRRWHPHIMVCRETVTQRQGFNAGWLHASAFMCLCCWPSARPPLPAPPDLQDAAKEPSPWFHFFPHKQAPSPHTCSWPAPYKPQCTWPSKAPQPSTRLWV